MLFAFGFGRRADLAIVGRRHAVLLPERAVEAGVVAEAVGATYLGNFCAGADRGGAGGETLFAEIPMDRKSDALLKEMGDVVFTEIELLRNPIQ